MPLTEWQNHLNEYRDRHPDLSLKECMQKASKSYRGISSSENGNKSEKKPTKDNNTKIVLKDVIGLTKAISHITTSLNRNELKKIQQVADQLQKIHDNHYAEESQSDSDSRSEISD